MIQLLESRKKITLGNPQALLFEFTGESEIKNARLEISVPGPDVVWVLGIKIGGEFFPIKRDASDLKHEQFKQFSLLKHQKAYVFAHYLGFIPPGFCDCTNLHVTAALKAPVDYTKDEIKFWRNKYCDLKIKVKKLINTIEND